ncbi:hypothetical protein AQU20_21475 [Escherichia albertii]|nr:hypothetical protein AQU20_21475 [Escherichia albertii]
MISSPGSLPLFIGRTTTDSPPITTLGETSVLTVAPQVVRSCALTAGKSLTDTLEEPSARYCTGSCFLQSTLSTPEGFTCPEGPSTVGSHSWEKKAVPLFSSMDA